MAKRRYPIVEGGRKADNGYIICDGCGKELVGRMVLHWDGPKYYGTHYKCSECGNVIQVTYKRSKDDLLYHDE